MRQDSSIPIIVICGPTASGKTALAVDMALRFGGEVISADSRQVYRGLDIGTGKDMDEYVRPEGSVPCHLVDIVDPGETYSLYRYIGDCLAAIGLVHGRKHLPILAGGTGLYIEAVLKNYDVPHVPEDAELRRNLMELDRDELDRRLFDLDPVRHGTTDLSSRKRIVRSLEVAMAGGGASPEVKGAGPPLQPLVLAVRWSREVLVARIDRRLRARLEQGMVDEVKGLLEAGIPAGRLLDMGMEYRYITRYLQGDMDFDNMVENLRVQIHRLAKRQMTWFRGMERRGVHIHWIDNADAMLASSLIERFI